MDDPKYCPYHQHISHFIKDCFVLKGNIQDLVNSRDYILTPDLIKVPVNLTTIKEGPPEENLLEAPNTN